MNEIKFRWLVKSDGTKVLQRLEQISSDSYRYIDIETEYEDEYARHNYTSCVKIWKHDIDITTFENGHKRIIRMVHLPTGCSVESLPILGTHLEREDLTKQLIKQVLKYCEDYDI